MLPTDPNSTSELLRAEHIVVTAIESITFGARERDGDMLVSRSAEARLRLQQVLKGELDVPVDRIVAATFRVFENDGPRFVALPGAWSRQTLEAGTRHVLFSSSQGRDPKDLLDESAIFRVDPADTALPEIEAVLSVESAKPSEPRKRLPEALAAMAGRRTDFTGLVARYVAWRLRELLFNDLVGFDVVLCEAEHPDTAAVFRQIVAIEAYDDFMMMDPAPSRFVARLIWGSLRSIADGPGAALGDRLVGTYIPNLLGLEGGLEPKSASVVFHEDERFGREVEAILRARPDLSGRDRVLQWLVS